MSRRQEPNPNVTEIIVPTIPEVMAGLDEMTKRGIEESREEVMQRGIKAIRESLSPAAPAKPEAKSERMQAPKEGVKPSEPKGMLASKKEVRSYFVLPLSKPWTVGLVIAVVLAVAVTLVLVVKTIDKPRDSTHVEPVASAASIPSAATSVVPTSPPRASDSAVATEPVETQPPSIVQPPTHRPKTAPPAGTAEKKNETPSDPVTAASPQARTAVPAPTTPKTPEEPRGMKFLGEERAK